MHYLNSYLNASSVTTVSDLGDMTGLSLSVRLDKRNFLSRLIYKDTYWFLLPETFGSLLSQIRLSTVTFVRPAQGLKLPEIFLRHFVPELSFDPCAKFDRDRPRGTFLVGGVKRKCSKIERCHVLLVSLHIRWSLLWSISDLNF